MEIMFNNSRKILILSFVSILFLGVFADEAGAVIQTSIDISPNPAQVNSPVQIRIDASDSANSILLIDYDINGRYEDGYDCTNGTLNPVNTCTAIFTKQFSSEGSYRISGVITDANTALISLPEMILNVTLSGDLPPPSPGGPAITDISPSPAPLGSTISILGTNFCSNIDFDISLITVIFDQTSISGGTTISIAPLSRSHCDVLYVNIPSSLIPNNDVEVSIQNTGGVSAPVNLPLEPAPPPGTTPGNGGATTRNCGTYCLACGSETDCGQSSAQCQWDQAVNKCCGRLEANWPPSPFGTQLASCSLTVLVKYIYEWGIGIGGLAAFIALVIAGFQYLTSVGNAAKMKDAMGRIQSAILGLILLLGSVLILNTINPQLTTIKIPPITLSGDELNITAENEIASGLGALRERCDWVRLFPGTAEEEEDFDGMEPCLSLGPEGRVDNLSASCGDEVGSVQIDGGCKLILYRLEGHNVSADDPSENIFNTTLNIETLTGTKKFRSAKVTKTFGR